MWMIQSLFHILFPPECIGCGKNQVALCEHCLLLSRKSLSSSVPFVTTAFDFRDPVIKKAIHAIKYYHRKDLIAPLTSILCKEIRNIPLIEAYTLIPVPMPRTRKLLRGYNQAEQIASSISSILNMKVRADILVRSKNPKRQVKSFTRKERLKNQAGSFSVAQGVAGMNLLLIDDVTTTGATLEEARKILLKNGARSVYAATLAH